MPTNQFRSKSEEASEVDNEWIGKIEKVIEVFDRVIEIYKYCLCDYTKGQISSLEYCKYILKYLIK